MSGGQPDETGYRPLRDNPPVEERRFSVSEVLRRGAATKSGHVRHQRGQSSELALEALALFSFAGVEFHHGCPLRLAVPTAGANP